ncbi:MAG TPA: riboflavin biosynthesis protein RibF [Enhygromyxa sp.]|nr:riboflavin biosynthesis protein RibF [Enhygromyxa sp.]
MRTLDFSSASGSAELVALPPGTAACIGAFDGMHRGHQGLIARARRLADEVAVVTFEPRPVDVLAPDRAPPRLQTPHQRERVCRQLGVDTLAVLRFDLQVSRMSPAEFVQAFLIDGLRPARVVVGYDFHFGAGRAGGPRELAALLEPVGVEVDVVEKIGDSSTTADKVGSTAIRELVGRGEVEHAAELLGRWYAVAGVVEHGAARGRTLGYPTANVASRSLHPAGGVYACALTLLGPPAADGERGCWPAVANIGSNPTFGSGAPRTLEVHVFDHDLGDDLYGHEVEVSFVARLRDELRFDGPEQLRQAIAADIEAARPLLTGAALERRHARLVGPEPRGQP